MHYIGIDISKSKLNLAWFEDQSCCKSEISNDISSIVQWVRTLAQEECHLIFEATGPYGSRLMYVLRSEGIAFTMLNPSQSKGFVQVKNTQNHTDDSDAIALAEYGLCIRPAATGLNGGHWEDLQQVRRTLRQMKKYARMLGNQLHALDQYPIVVAQARQALESALQVVQQESQKLEQKICDLTNEEMNSMAQQISTIGGIGAVTARELIIATNGFLGFSSAKQVAKFIGIAPASKTSGSSVRQKGRISRRGDGALRATLYMAALSASRCNHACKELYIRLKNKGRSTKQALIAVAHKLLRQAFGVIKSGQDFDNEYYKKFQTA